MRWVEFERRASLTLALVALLAVAIASLIGLVLADRVVRPLRRLGSAASAVAGGDLSRRSGLADRRDEIGELGRSFDSMAEALESADTGRRRFLQDVVHELRTPLTVIDATASAMLDGVYDLEPGHIETIREQSHLLSRIVGDLRTLDLAEVGQLPLTLVELEAGDLLEATVASFSARAAAGGQSLTSEAEPDLHIRGDADRLRQALAALTDNALRHTPPGGEVRLRASETAGRVRVSVEDTGPGVAAADLDRVFERFYEADPARDRAAGHTGLGLAIVKALVEAHGGRVGVGNVEGAGARFWFEVPATSAAREAPGAGRPSAGRGSRAGIEQAAVPAPAATPAPDTAPDGRRPPGH